MPKNQAKTNATAYACDGPDSPGRLVLPQQGAERRLSNDLTAHAMTLQR